MRILILGIDALEYDLVEEWDLKHLKQVEYGKTKVPIVEGWKEPATVIVWPCFITGKKDPKEMGYDSPILFNQPMKLFFDYVHRPIRNFIFSKNYVEDISEKGTDQKILNVFKEVTKKTGLTRSPKRGDIKAKTMFENKNYKSIHLHVPVYDEEMDTLERWKIFDVFDGKMDMKDFIKGYKKEYLKRCDELLYLLDKKNWNLMMMYWFYLDAIQHALFKDKMKIMDSYMMFNDFVGKIKNKLSKDDMILIISDHGQKKGIHTTYGFYSCSKKLGLKNPHISDFKDIIEKKLSKGAKK